jgi:hypothetical protein
MALKQCEQCSEMVDEAKAFCPGCGNAFVSEKPRAEVSEFDQMGHTVQLGQTMYNQMLTDMGLNISKTPERAASEPAPTAVAQGPVVKQPKRILNKWLIVAIVAVLFLFFAAVLVIAAAIVVFYFPLIRS